MDAPSLTPPKICSFLMPRDTESRGPVERVYRLRRDVVENADVRIVNDDRVFPSRALGDDCEVARRGRLIEGQLLHRGV